MSILSGILITIGLFIGGPEAPLTIDPGTDPETLLEAEIAAAQYLSPDEKAMLWEINLLRSDPQSYIPFVNEVYDRLRTDSARLSNIVSESIRRRVTEIDGQEVIQVDTTYKNYYADKVKAIRELLVELQTAKPVGALKPSFALYQTALQHGVDQIPFNYVDHVGQDGSWPQDRILSQSPSFKDGNENIVRGLGQPRDLVIQLLIDSGVETRGHRKNLLDARWTHIGCYHVRPLDDRGLSWWIQEFAF